MGSSGSLWRQRPSHKEDSQARLLIFPSPPTSEQWNIHRRFSLPPSRLSKVTVRSLGLQTKICTHKDYRQFQLLSIITRLGSVVHSIVSPGCKYSHGLITHLLFSPSRAPSQCLPSKLDPRQL